MTPNRLKSIAFDCCRAKNSQPSCECVLPMMVHHETPLPPLVPKMIPGAIVTRAPSSYEHDKRRRPDPRCAHIKHSKKTIDIVSVSAF